MGVVLYNDPVTDHVVGSLYRQCDIGTASMIMDGIAVQHDGSNHMALLIIRLQGGTNDQLLPLASG